MSNLFQVCSKENHSKNTKIRLFNCDQSVVSFKLGNLQSKIDIYWSIDTRIPLTNFNY